MPVLVDTDAGRQLLHADDDGERVLVEEMGVARFARFARTGWLDVDAPSPEPEPELVTDGGEDRCCECGAYLPDEIEPGAGVYCPECGTGQLVTDGGVEVATDDRALDVGSDGDTQVNGEPFDGRAAKALVEYMTVLEDTPEVRGDDERFEVVSEHSYVVDLRSGSCSCPDALHRGVTCKHQRRVRFATGREPIPAWVDHDAIHDRLGEHVTGTPLVDTPAGARPLGEVRR